MSFPKPQSRNEAILQNILGASNQLQPPQSRIEDLLLQLLDKLAAMEGVVRYIGVTTTELTDGSTTNPITINGASVTAVNGDTVFYNGTAYSWDGSAWQEVMSLSQIITMLEEMQAEIGDLSDLTTTNKTSVVDAVNELDGIQKAMALDITDGALQITKE